jgi:2,4-dienoyl-CoA reductase-like NADH-dependent reductase (Old Yellow Enzyme family)
MANLFSPIVVNGLEIPNRIIISPMCQYSATQGEVTDWHLGHYLQMACSGSGMFFIEATAVAPNGRITPFDLGLYNDIQLEKIASLVKLCRSFSAAKVALQISHAGRKGSCERPTAGGTSLGVEAGGWLTWSASPIAREDTYPKPQELSINDMNDLTTAYAQSAFRAKEAGIDCLEVHMAHGYLLHQFISPISNQRVDKYGGALKNRCAWPIEIMKAVRKSWGPNKPLGIRVSAFDWLPGGLTLTDAANFVSMLKKEACIDYVSVTSGGIIPRTNLQEGPHFQVPFAQAIRQQCDIPVIAVGRITNPINANQIIESNSTDFIAIARSYLANPRWVWNAAKALHANIDVPHQYVRGFTF